jgi:DNA modification methylase
LRAAEKRGETTDYQGQESSGTSIFDPVLCELAYRWFCPPGGLVIDPFAGGSVRGVVAALCGRCYTGTELRPEQVAANREQWTTIPHEGAPEPAWYEDDGVNLDAHLDGKPADMIFTCPPYADLEVYSDDPRDLSSMDYPAFVTAYREIILRACAALAGDRFACIVVGDVRAPDGTYRNFPGDTTKAFLDAGLKLYNEAILVTACGSLPIRAGKQFESGRKLGKTHQNVLVFVKGDWRKATAAVGPVDFGETESPAPPPL